MSSVVKQRHGPVRIVSVELELEAAMRALGRELRSRGGTEAEEGEDGAMVEHSLLRAAASSLCFCFLSWVRYLRLLVSCRVMVEQDGRDGADQLLGEGDVQELVGTVRVRARTQHSSDHELRLWILLAEHALREERERREEPKSKKRGQRR